MPSSLRTLLVLSLLAATGCMDVTIREAPEVEGDEPGECSDGADNDNDELFDCEDEGCATAPDCIPDQPPTTPSVSISPAEPRTTDMLLCNIDEPSADPEGEPVEYSYSWTVDGVQTELYDATIHPDATRRDHVWVCTVEATDGALRSAPAAATALVVNTPPTQPTVHVFPNYPTVRDNFSCLLAEPSEDADEDSIEYLVEWSVDGIPHSGGEEISWSHTQFGEVWTCAMKASDGFDESEASEGSIQIEPLGLTFISAGRQHSCSILFGGLVTCWGIDDGSADDQGEVADTPTEHVVEVTSGENHACGLIFDRPVCWGDDSQGQASPDSGLYMQLSAGYQHTCGVNSWGGISCWGTAYSWTDPAPVTTAVEVRSGNEFSCALMLEGHIECWNTDLTPPEGSDWVTLDVGGDHGCAIDSAGQLTCFGDDTHGQVSGQPEGLLFSQVSAGDTHTCALEQSTGYAHCWGADDSGQVSGAPTGVFNYLTAGWTHSCGRRPNDSFECWGCGGSSTDHGQCSPP